MNEVRAVRGIPLRALAPNAVTALVLCFGLTGVRFAIGGEWDKALGAIVFAGVLDGMDGRIARLLKAQSKFGAELDSLCDNIGFGTAPALILFQFSLDNAPKFGWTVALALCLRQSEALALQWKDIDLERGTLSVRRGPHCVAGEGLVPTEPKQTAAAAPSQCRRR